MFAGSKGEALCRSCMGLGVAYSITGQAQAQKKIKQKKIKA